MSAYLGTCPFCKVQDVSTRKVEGTGGKMLYAVCQSCHAQGPWQDTRAVGEKFEDVRQGVKDLFLAVCQRETEAPSDENSASEIQMRFAKLEESVKELYGGINDIEKRLSPIARADNFPMFEMWRAKLDRDVYEAHYAEEYLLSCLRRDETAHRYYHTNEQITITIHRSANQINKVL